MRSKGRNERCTPISKPTRQGLQTRLRELGGDPTSPLFPTRRGTHLTRGAIWRLLGKHVATARSRCPSLATKNITPHGLRHYVDGSVMWPAGVFPLLGLARASVPAT